MNCIRLKKECALELGSNAREPATASASDCFRRIRRGVEDARLTAPFKDERRELPVLNWRGYLPTSATATEATPNEVASPVLPAELLQEENEPPRITPQIAYRRLPFRIERREQMRPETDTGQGNFSGRRISLSSSDDEWVMV